MFRFKVSKFKNAAPRIPKREVCLDEKFVNIKIEQQLTTKQSKICQTIISSRRLAAWRLYIFLFLHTQCLFTSGVQFLVFWRQNFRIPADIALQGFEIRWPDTSGVQGHCQSPSVRKQKCAHQVGTSSLSVKLCYNVSCCKLLWQKKRPEANYTRRQHTSSAVSIIERFAGSWLNITNHHERGRVFTPDWWLFDITQMLVKSILLYNVAVC